MLRADNTALTEERDAFDADAFGSFRVGDIYAISGTDLEIDYTDINDATSRRIITLKEIWYDPANSGWMLRAHCHLRDANRYFRWDRISRLVDTTIGEVWDGDTVVPYLTQRLHDAPSFKLRTFAETDDGSDLLAVAIYVSRADGRVSKVEKDILARFLAKKTESQLTSDLELAIDKELAFQQVTLTKMRRARNRLKKSGLFNEAVGLCQELAGSRKSPSIHVEAALQELLR